MFNGYQPYPMPQGPAFQRPAFQQQPMMYQPNQMQPTPQPMLESNIQVRFVASREEAVAASVIPGMPCVFLNRAKNEIYYKAVDPNTGIPDFHDYFEKPQETAQSPQEAPAQPQAQFATLADLEALRGDLEALRTSITPKQTGRKVVPADE